MIEDPRIKYPIEHAVAEIDSPNRASDSWSSAVQLDMSTPFEVTRSRILELYQGDPEEHPGPAAFAAAWDILYETRSQVPAFPRGAACSDLEGGIRVEWSCGDRNVSLVIPASGRRKPYIYQGEGDNYSVVETSPTELVRRLNWLSH